MQHQAVNAMNTCRCMVQVTEVRETGLYLDSCKSTDYLDSQSGIRYPMISNSDN